MSSTDNQFCTRLTAILLIACCAILLSVSALAQSTLSPIAGTTTQALENRISEIEATVDLDSTVKGTLLELYNRISSLISQRSSYETATKEFARARESASEKARQLRADLEKLEAKATPQFLPRELLFKPLPELEQQLLSDKARLAALSANLSELEAVLESQSQRSTQVRDRLTEARTRATAITHELQIPAPESELALLSEARRWALEHEALALNTEIEMLDQELLSQPMRIELLSVQRDRATLDVKRLSDTVERLENLTIDRRGAEARTAKEQADEIQRQASGKHPLVQELAERNAQLGETLNLLAKSLEQVTDEGNTTSEQARRISESFRLARQKLEIAGLSQVLGQVLLEQSRNLPDSAVFRKAERRHNTRVVDSSLRQILNQQERGSLRDMADYVENLITWEPFYEQAKLRAELLILAEARRELLDKAIAADETYQQALGELDFARRQLFETVTAYEKFLDERLLWIRSGELPNWDTIKSIPQTLSIFLQLSDWRALVLALVLPSSSSWILIIGLILFATLLNRSRAIRAALRKSGNTIGQLRHDRFINTIAYRWHKLTLSGQRRSKVTND